MGNTRSGECYVVRIYRRGDHGRRLLLGTVESPGVEGKAAFYDFDELKKILNPRRGISRGKPISEGK